MTKVTFLNRNGHYTLICDGHAGDPADGENAACAVVSTAVLALISSLPEIFLDGAPDEIDRTNEFEAVNPRAEIRVRPGFAYIDLVPDPEDEDEISVLCAFAVNALAWGAREWPDKIGVAVLS